MSKDVKDNGACSAHGGYEKCLQNSVGKLEGNRSHERPKNRLDNNIKMDHREVGFGDVDWVHLTQDRDWRQVLGNMVMSLWLKKRAVNFLTS
jgi:hypothetical protein